MMCLFACFKFVDMVSLIFFNRIYKQSLSKLKVTFSEGGPGTRQHINILLRRETDTETLNFPGTPDTTSQNQLYSFNTHKTSFAKNEVTNSDF